MFTGIIQGIATVLSIKKKSKFYTYKIKFSNNLLFNLKIGASVSNNGCCLTVIKIKNNCVYFDVMEETLRITNFLFLSVFSKINIERALKFGDEIGGHLLSGHIINTAKIFSIITLKNNKKIYFQVHDISIMKYIFTKGFIAINGISLTVKTVYQDIFSVYFIPETVLKTNILKLVKGNIVNIEVDYYTQIIVDQVNCYLQ